MHFQPDDHDDDHKSEGDHGDVGHNPCSDKEIVCEGVPPPDVGVQRGELPPPPAQQGAGAKAR